MTIAIVKSKVTGNYNYCPAGTPLVRVLEYDDEGGFPSETEARAAIKRDKSIPSNAEIVLHES